MGFILTPLFRPSLLKDVFVLAPVILIFFLDLCYRVHRLGRLLREWPTDALNGAWQDPEPSRRRQIEPRLCFVVIMALSVLGLTVTVAGFGSERRWDSGQTGWQSVVSLGEVAPPYSCTLW